MAALFLLLTVAFAIWHVNRRTEWQQWQRAYNAAHPDQPLAIRIRTLTPTLTGKPELCTTCHVGIEEISVSHPLESFGCVVCHGGNGLALDKERAHAGLVGGHNPSDLSVARQACGSCHSGHEDEARNHVDRVLRSLQATYAGAIVHVRFTFGAQSDTMPRFGVFAVQDDAVTHSNCVPWLAPLPVSDLADLTPELQAQGVIVSGHPIDSRFRQACLTSGCHLSATPAAEPYRYRSTGCAACHYLYDDDGLYKGDDPTIPRGEPRHGRVHKLTVAIPFSQCNHCHNRGNYSLRQMRFLRRDDLPPVGEPLSEFMSRQERRLREYYQPIGQFTLCEWELDCIDCHTAQEAMGDGDIHPNQKEMQSVQCRTCHGTRWERPQTVVVTEKDTTALRQAQLNPYLTLEPGERVVVTRRGELLPQVKQVGDRLVETSKVTGQTWVVPLVMGTACQQKPDEQESHYCHACHAYKRGNGK
ncbi:MAG TPA: hypothetical protein EYP04_05295 [Anaerolineae bacterium]|nr:hypothetical protein [Anaerolineae bacterium]